MDIWNIHTTDSTTLLLLRTSETKFRVIQHGQPLTLLTNPDYVLIDKKYKAIIDKLTGQATCRPVTIKDEVRQLTFENFIEVKIQNQLPTELTIPIDDKGPKIWKYSDEYVFVSTDLKKEFQKITEDEFEFKVGLSNFAGSETGSR